MKMNKWTMGLAAAGVVSLASAAQAEENSVLTALSSTVISGSAEVSYNGNLSGNNKFGDQGFVANGASLAISSPLGEGDYSAGFNVDLLLGNRADAFGSAGDGFLIKNANIGLNVPFGNGIDLTVGLFDSIVGYETEASASNPNVSRSYGYGLGPLTHTGALASTSLTDGLNFSFGVANSFGSTLGNTADDLADGNLTYMVGVEATVPARAKGSPWALRMTIALNTEPQAILTQWLSMRFGTLVLALHLRVVMTRSIGMATARPCGLPRWVTPSGTMFSRAWSITLKQATA